MSTLDQNTVRQLEGIEVERTFIDKVSGKDTARPQLGELLEFVRFCRAGRSLVLQISMLSLPTGWFGPITVTIAAWVVARSIAGTLTGPRC